MLRRLLTFRCTATSFTKNSININCYFPWKRMADAMEQCNVNLGQQTDLHLKNYIKSRLVNVADAHLDDLSHPALVGYAKELQLLFNNKVASGEQNAPHLDGLAKLNAKFIVDLNDFYNINCDRLKGGKLNIILGTISAKAERNGAPNADALVNINSNNNNNNNNSNANNMNELSGFGDISALADMDTGKIKAIAELARLFQGASAVATKDKDGRDNKRRRLNNNNNNNSNTVCINYFFIIFLSFSCFF